MKKTFLLTGMIACLAFGYAQGSTKQGRTENAGPNDPKVLALLKAQQSQEAIKDCGDEHLGKVVFHNKTAKSVSLDLYASGGKGETINVTIPAGESVYVNDLLVGEYKYKRINEKKPKKKDFVNVLECTLKVVLIDK